MSLAHGAGAGPNIEALVLAVPMIVVGVILFVQRSAKPVVSVMLVLGGVAIGWGGFTFLDGGDDHDGAAASGAAAETYSGAVDGLCQARERLADGDVSGARASFLDRSHGSLHEMADRLAEQDRSAAAELHQSKEAVESGFDEGDESSLQRDLDELIVAAVRGSAELGAEVTGCE